MTYEFLETLYDDILSMLSNIVVKRSDLAREAETADTIKAFELYHSCLTGNRYFYNFEKFDSDILEKYLTPAEVLECFYNPNRIPEDLRQVIVEDQAQRVISTYEEKNEYYRMLNGLPRTDDIRWIYVSGYSDIPSDIPIHELSIEQIAHLELRGELEELKKENPEAKYLDYLGVNKIEVLDARLAKPFEILRLGQSNNALARDMFESEYYMARRYVMATVYNRRLFTAKTLYDPIIGVIILTLAIRNTLVPTEAEYLNFDEILNAILESYGLLQYFENFPFTFKKRLVLALDKILQVKGTDGVLVDICRIFSFDNFHAKRYFLLKTPAMDEDRNFIMTGDPEKDHDLNFVKADIEDRDISYQEEDITPYDQIVSNDYLWQLTEDERKQILSEDFNIMMTKYVGIEAAYDVSSLTFEVCYFINLLLQSKVNIMKIYCANMYSINNKASVRTMLLFLLALLAKRSEFDGNIVYEPQHIAEILRFNYGDINDEVQAIVDKYELQIDIDNKILSDRDTVGLKKPVGMMKDYEMVEVYLYNRDLYNAILKEMHDTTDIRRYIALMNAKNCMYISAMEQSDFQTLDGSPANTYYEALETEDPSLARVVDSYNPEENLDDLNKVILYTLEKLEETFNSPELSYLFLNTPNAYGTLIQKYLRMAINVFKAAPVQLESINVFLNVGDSEPIRIIDQKKIEKTVNVDEVIHVQDELAFHKTIFLGEYLRVGDKPYFNE